MIVFGTIRRATFFVAIMCSTYDKRERERERERERIFIKINRNNDTIIIQCMDYTD